MADRRRALRLLAEIIADAIWAEAVETDSRPPAAGDEESLQPARSDGGSNGTHETQH